MRIRCRCQASTPRVASNRSRKCDENQRSLDSRKPTQDRKTSWAPKKERNKTKRKSVRRNRYMPSKQPDPRLPTCFKTKEIIIVVELIHAILVGPL